MNEITFTADNQAEYELALHSLRYFGDQIIDRNSDTLTLIVTPLGAAAIDNALGRKI